MLIIFFVIANLICSTLLYANEDIAFYKAYRTAKSQPKTFYKTKQASHQAPLDKPILPATPIRHPLINLNTATVETLGALPFIGIEQAKSIIAYREQLVRARFTSIEQLLEIPEFNAQLLKQLRAHVFI